MGCFFFFVASVLLRWVANWARRIITIACSSATSSVCNKWAPHYHSQCHTYTELICFKISADSNKLVANPNYLFGVSFSIAYAVLISLKCATWFSASMCFFMFSCEFQIKQTQKEIQMRNTLSLFFCVCVSWLQESSRKVSQSSAKRCFGRRCHEARSLRDLWSGSDVCGDVPGEYVVVHTGTRTLRRRHTHTHTHTFTITLLYSTEHATKTDRTGVGRNQSYSRMFSWFVMFWSAARYIFFGCIWFNGF